MSEDLTKKLPKTDSERLDLILTTTQSLGGRFDHLEARLQDLEKKVEERLYDTRPIWHKVVANIAQLQTGQQSLAATITELQTGQDSLGANIGELQSGQHGLRSLIFELSSRVSNVSRDQIVINDAIRRLHLDFHILDERLHDLLIKRNQQNSST
jgi:chromosome segregation ATPase